ncbi:MAG: DUF6734 family protein [Chitinophagaceae bacterium]
MKVVQTFRPEAESHLSAMKGGWLSAEYHWMAWALSCLRLRKYFESVELVTSEAGKQLLIDTLELPYTNVSTALENKLQDYPPQLWSLAKIFTYSIQQEPFIHFDGDVFLWDRPDRSWQHADLIAQNLELNLFFYRETLNDIKQHFSYIPECLSNAQQADNILASNTGIFGGKNIAFIRRYAAEAFSFVDNNLQHIHKTKAGNLNFIFEQLLLHCLAEKAQLKINYVIPDIVDNPLYQQFVRFEDIPYIKMIHPVGGFKRDQFVCNHLAKRLRKEYPEYYYRILSFCKKNAVPVQGRIYNFIHVDGTDINSDDSAIIEQVKSDQFIRTRACIKYIRTLNNLPVDEQENENTIDEFINTITDPLQKEFLSEIFKLEQEKVFCYDMLPNARNAADKYLKAKSRYEAATGLFEATDKNVWNMQVEISPETKRVELGWKWQYTYPAEVDAMIKAQFDAEPSLWQVALVQDVIRLSVEEYYLDQLDMIIVESIGSGTTIKQVAEAAAQYFEPKEIQEEPASFNKLIIDSVRRLSYAGVLRIN